MRLRRKVVLPEPRKPVTIVTGIGAMVTVERSRVECDDAFAV